MFAVWQTLPSVSDSLFHEESVDGLLSPHEQDKKSVYIDKQRPTKTTGNAAEREREMQRKTWEIGDIDFWESFYLCYKFNPWVSACEDILKST